MFNDKISSFLILTRPLSNIKNIAIFLLAFYFSGSSFDLGPTILGILAISLISSASYCYNSYTDYLVDQKNANKKHYSDSVKNFGYQNIPYVFSLMFIAGIFLSLFINLYFSFVCLIFFITNFLYSTPATRFKEKPVLDILFGAFLTYPLRFLAGWYVYTNSIPPLLILTALAFAKSGGYMLYKELDRKYLSELNIKNTITLLSKARLIFTAFTFIAFSITSYLLLSLNFVYFKIDFLGSLSPNSLFLLPLGIPPLFIIYKQTQGLTKINNRLLRVVGLLYFIFILLIAWLIIL